MESENDSLLPSSRDSYLVDNTLPAPSASRRFLLCIFALKFIEKFIAALLEVPIVQLIESVACRQYYGLEHGLSLRDQGTYDCKVAGIQNRVALVLGLKATFDAIPGLLTTLWYGTLADRYGRRPVLALASVGGLLSWGWVCFICFSRPDFDVRYIWVGSLFFLVGGGDRVYLGMLFTTCADVITWHKRSQVMFRLHALSHIARMVAPLLAAMMLNGDLKFPFLLMAALMLTRILLIAALPETLPQRHAIASTEEQSRAYTSFISSYMASLNPPSMKTMLKHAGMVIIFVAFVIKRVAFSSETLVFQYASTRMNVALYTTVWLRILNTVGAILSVSVYLPLLGYIGSWRSPSKDLIGMKVSLATAVTGFLILFVASNFTTLCFGMIVAGLAEGLEPSLQALGTYIVGDAFNAKFFTCVGFLDLVAELFGRPLMAFTYSVYDANSLPAGYHFLLSAVLFAVLLGATYMMNISRLSSRATP